MVRCLLGNVVCSLVVPELPVTGKDFAKNRVEWLLDTSDGLVSDTMSLQR